ncbi:MAG: sulfite exporter TauE/SafE family protein [Sulfurimicrobium sp.]|nr:sulfite exporter TauE/SafE family protein [Sulfurimicrobium sp.]
MAYFIRGISGFGSGLIAVPLLAHFLPLQFVVPFILLLDFTASVVMGRNARQHVNWKEIKPLLPFSLIGVVLGVVLLIHLPKEPLLTGLGLFVMAFGVRNILDLHNEKPISQWWAIPAGLTGGTVGALFGTGGPPYIVYLSHRLRDKSELRATFTGLFMIDGGSRLVAFLVTGLLLQPGLLLAYLGALPIVALGLKLGHKVHLGLTNQQMLRLIGTLLLGSGVSLLWKAWG